MEIDWAPLIASTFAGPRDAGLQVVHFRVEPLVLHQQFADLGLQPTAVFVHGLRRTTLQPRLARDQKLITPLRGPRRRDPQLPRHGLEILSAQQTQHCLALAPGLKSSPTAAPSGPSGRPPGFLRRRRAGLDPDAARLAQSEVRQGYWMSSMTRFAFPRIGTLPVSEVTSADVIETLRPVWHVRPATARRVRERISTVMEWAVAMDLRADNPCDRIGPVLGPQQNLVQHMRALPHRDVAAAIGAVQASGAPPVVTLAFEFLVLTAARSGEVRGAQWAEVDAENHVWTIPATRTKAKREHRVPLCRRAAQILDAARALGDGHALVFPSGRGKRLADMALSGLLKDLAIGGVPHGFRSSFRDWTAEETNHPREVVKAALAHVVQNKVEAAYARSDLFERRRLETR